MNSRLTPSSRTGFQILGHVKTVLVLFVGWAFFATSVSARGIGGSIIAMCGIVAYSIVSDRARTEVLRIKDVEAPIQEVADRELLAHKNTNSNENSDE
jgi:hypothetical protein